MLRSRPSTPRGKPTLQIDPDDRIENCFVIFLHRHDFALDAGIIEEAVDGTISVERDFNVILHIAGFRDIGTDKASVAAMLTHKFGARLASNSIEINHHNIGTALREAERRGAADAATAAGNQCNLAGEFHPHPLEGYLDQPLPAFPRPDRDPDQIYQLLIKPSEGFRRLPSGAKDQQVISKPDFQRLSKPCL
jgi:hypothetical protein